MREVRETTDKWHARLMVLYHTRAGEPRCTVVNDRSGLLLGRPGSAASVALRNDHELDRHRGVFVLDLPDGVTANQLEPVTPESYLGIPIRHIEY